MYLRPKFIEACTVSVITTRAKVVYFNRQYKLSNTSLGGNSRSINTRENVSINPAAVVEIKDGAALNCVMLFHIFCCERVPECRHVTLLMTYTVFKKLPTCLVFSVLFPQYKHSSDVMYACSCFHQKERLNCVLLTVLSVSQCCKKTCFNESRAPTL